MLILRRGIKLAKYGWASKLGIMFGVWRSHISIEVERTLKIFLISAPEHQKLNLCTV